MIVSQCKAKKVKRFEKIQDMQTFLKIALILSLVLFANAFKPCPNIESDENEQNFETLVIFIFKLDQISGIYRYSHFYTIALWSRHITLIQIDPYG